MANVTEVVVPQMNVNDDQAVLVGWHVTSGSWVDAEQPLATLETSKTTFDVIAPCAGYAFFEHEPKTFVAVGAIIVWISSRNEQPTKAAAMPTATDSSATDAGRFTRKALKLMKDAGLTVEDFPPTMKVDVATVENLIKERGSLKAVSAPASAEIIEPTSTKMIEAHVLSQVYRQVVPSTVAVALSKAKLAERQRRTVESAHPSLLELVIYESAHLLRDFPDLNGFHVDGKQWRHTSVNVGFAVNIGKGLRVPVVKGTAELTLAEICRATRDLSLRYMRGELTLDDCSGGSFTITDLSGFGVHHFVPVLNERQSAILGICAERPGTDCQDLVLTFDHRCSDGMRAATFLSELTSRLSSANGSSAA
jgi:pyruvate/2-oxoglutarate dehydrogenase complex dihydrolipoamide acyltransferase (E2) component